MALVSSNTNLQANFVDANGSPVTDNPNVSWSSDDTAVVSVAATDPLHATVSATGVGSANITATITNPSGTTVTTSPFSVTVTDVPAEAVSGTITAV